MNVICNSPDHTEMSCSETFALFQSVDLVEVVILVGDFTVQVRHLGRQNAYFCPNRQYRQRQSAHTGLFRS